MREIWTADSETDPFKKKRIPKPFIWGAYTVGQYHEFRTADEFVDFISEIECIVYAHNGGKFDWFNILHRLSPFDEITVINGRIAKMKIGKAEFRDSYNIIPVPLAQYKKDDIDYSIMEESERHKPHNWQKIREYLKSDCIYLHDLVTAFIERYGLNLTLAGAAMKQWQLISDVTAPETNKSFYADISPFYYGGRVECFKSGVIKANRKMRRYMKLVDINSAYPEAMQYFHPYGDSYTVSDQLPETRVLTERAFISLICVSRGALPFRHEGKLTFPNDEHKRLYHVTGWEFVAALDTKTISDIEIVEVVEFAEFINFKFYVEFFYAMKSTSKKGSPEYIFAKLFLNSLYGKFAANPENYSEYQVVPPRYIDAAGSEGYDYCCELAQYALMQRPLSEEKHRYYNVAVAASITGFVRAKLWRAINEVDTPLYCDTDSLLCMDTGRLTLHPTNLGAWDLEAEIDSAAICGKKMYSLRKSPEWHAQEMKKDPKAKLFKTASKGVRLSPEELFRAANGEEIEFEPETPTYSIARGVGFTNRKVRRTA